MIKTFAFWQRVNSRCQFFDASLEEGREALRLFFVAAELPCFVTLPGKRLANRCQKYRFALKWLDKGRLIDWIMLTIE